LADDTKFAKGLKSAERRLHAWGAAVAGIGTRMMGIGAAISLPMLGASRVFANTGDQLAKMSQRTGLSVEALSELSYVASQSGTSIEVFEKVVARMQQAIVEAGEGSKTAVDALKLVGLSVAQLAGLSPEDQLMAIADGISKIEDPTVKAAAAMQLFGRSGTQVLPMLADGRNGIAELRQKARDFGLTMSTETAVAAVKLTGSLDTLFRGLKQISITVGAALAPVFTGLDYKLAGMAKTVSGWIKEHQGLIISVLKGAAAFTLAGAAVFTFGKAISIVGSGLGILRMALATLHAGLSGVLTLASVLATPFGLIAVAAIGAAGALLYFSGTGTRMVSYMRGVFEGLRADAIESFGAIGKALASGDLAAAAKVAWSLIKMEFIAGSSWIIEKWAATKAAFLSTWANASTGLAKMMVSAFALVQSAWLSTTTALSDAWTMVTSFIGDAWDSVVAWIAKRWADVKGLFVEGIDVDAEKRAIDESTSARQQARADATGKALAATEQEARAKQEAIDASRSEMLSGIDDQSRAELDAIANNRNAQIDAAKAAAHAARDEWKRAMEGAVAAKRTAAAPGTPEAYARPTPDLTADLRDTVTHSVVGTFSGYGARGLGTGREVTRIAENTQRTNKLLEQIRDNRPVWGA